MNYYVVLGGYGEMGQIIVRDLFKTTTDIIWVVGHDAKKAKIFASSFKNPRVKWAALDVNNVNKLADFLKGKSICINSTQYYFNLSVMRACIASRISYIDLGGLFHMTKKQLKLHAQFKKRGILGILGCGATPGITNVMAAYGATAFDRIYEIHITFAGKDYTHYDQPFVLPYSAQTIFDEFSIKAAKLINGRMYSITPFSDEEKEKFPQPIGETVCGSILHSELGTFPRNFKLRACSFKAGFDREFIAFFKLLVKLGFANKPWRDRAVNFLNEFLPSPKTKIKDIEILRVTLIGIKNKKGKKLAIDCKTKSNTAWNAPAGTVDTAIPPSIISQMIVRGIIQKSGVYPPELCVPPSKFFAELKKRDISVKITFKN